MQQVIMKNLHLKDIIEKVVFFQVYDDISEAHFSDDSVTRISELFDDDCDLSQEADLLNFSDNYLKQLPQDLILTFTNTELLDRYYGIDPELLSREQLEKIQKNYKKKIVIDSSDVSAILEKFKLCDRLFIVSRPKNNTFLSKYDLYVDDCLRIIHQLTVEDYYASTKGYNLEHFGHNLIIFEPKNIKIRDIEIPELAVYIKIDLDESSNNCIVAVSFHDIPNQNKLTYEKENIDMKEDYIQSHLFDFDDDLDESIEEDIYYDRASGTAVTQQKDPDHANLFIYRCYDDDLVCFSTWKLKEDAASMSPSAFDHSACKKIIDREIENHSKNSSYRFNSIDYARKATSQPVYRSNSYFSWEPKYISKEEAFEKYNKSNTLCLHKSDPTTTMLDQIYRGKGWDVINDSYSVSREVLAELIDSHERIVMLGHGSGGGLIGFFGSEMAEHLKDKKLFALWCNADAYCNRYLPNKKGFFACGNMPSDDREARWVGFNVSHKYMDDNITYWCKLCGDVVEECLEGNADKGCQYIREKYWEKYGHSENPDEVGITLYNYQRTKVAGQDLIDPPADYVAPTKNVEIVSSEIEEVPEVK